MGEMLIEEYGMILEGISFAFEMGCKMPYEQHKLSAGPQENLLRHSYNAHCLVPASSVLEYLVNHVKLSVQLSTYVGVIRAVGHRFGLPI